MDEAKNPGIKIAQIFVGRTTFEHDPILINDPVGTQAGAHLIQVMISGAVSEDHTAGICTVMARTTAENKGCYRFLVEVVGVFETDPDAKNMEIDEYIKHYAPATLSPFLREAVANITGRGRFGSVWLSPLNFAVAEIPDELQVIPSQ